MSDGALSQDEIDSLLAGLDPGAGGGKKAGGAPAKPTAELNAFKAMLDSIGSTQAQNLSMITGQDVSFGDCSVDATTRDGLLPSLPDEVLAVSVDMVGGIPGDHCYLLPKDVAVRVASLANKDESLTDMDDMAISAVSECVSSMTGTQITLFTEKTGNRQIQSEAAEGSFGPKAIARLPSGEFCKVQYDITIGGEAFKFWEVYALSFVKDIAAASGVRPAEAVGQAPMAPMGGQPQQAYQQAYQQQPAFQQGMMGMVPQQQYQSPMMGMAAPNVQPVQFASLSMGRPGQESGNIGLIMDVYMELTVELGRTKKLIKDILGLGEGTILELDKLAGEPVDILVNHKLIAKGEVVVIDENFGVRVTEIVSPMERMADMS